MVRRNVHPMNQGDPPELEGVRRQNLHPEDFTRWLELFQRTVDDLYAGPRAERAKRVAASIDGKLLFTHEAEEGAYDGMPALFVQNCVAEFKRISVKR